MDNPSYLRVQGSDILLSVKLQPRASKNEIGEVLGNELRIKVTAPPVDAAANQALIEMLADLLHCGRNRVALIRGQTSRHKTLRLCGFTVAQVMEKLGLLYPH